MHSQIPNSEELPVFCKEECAECGEQKGLGQDHRAYIDHRGGSNVFTEI